MKRKINIERIALIIGTILGVIGFFWQVYDSFDKQREKINVEISFKLPKEDLPIKLSVDIINVGQRPVYIRSIFISNNGFRNHAAPYIFESIEDKSETEPIQPGESRESSIEIGYQDLQVWFESNSQIHLIVKSPINTLLDNDIRKCIEEANFVASVGRKSENEFLLSTCTP